MEKITVILPAYGEEKNIDPAVRAVSEVLESCRVDYELLFVDDGSRDGTWERICAAAKENGRVHGIRFSRNFGKEAAMFAGLEAARGDACVVMDCDLQHPPETIPEMIRLWREGYQVVEGVKEDRGTESAAHSAAARLFYRWISRASGMDMSSASDFKLLDRAVVDALNAMPERSVFFRALSHWVGFRSVSLPFSVRERTAGESKWSTSSLIRYAFRNMSAFSSAPLHIVTILGMLMLAAALVFGTIALVQKLTGTALGGFTTVILLQLFTGSLLMISLGIIGLYIGRIYEEIKGRPRYIVSDTCGKKKQD